MKQGGRLPKGDAFLRFHTRQNARRWNRSRRSLPRGFPLWSESAKEKTLMVTCAPSKPKLGAFFYTLRGSKNERREAVNFASPRFFSCILNVDRAFSYDANSHFN